MKKATHTIVVELCDYTLEVDYIYEHDAGVWTYSNGDPGYPESTDIDILSAVDTESNTDILHTLSASELATIEEHICEQHAGDYDEAPYDEDDR